MTQAAPAPTASFAGSNHTSPTPTPTKLLYDRKSAAYALSISVRSLDYLIGNKRLDTIKLGSKVMVPHGSLVKFSRQHHATLTA